MELRSLRENVIRLCAEHPDAGRRAALRMLRSPADRLAFATACRVLGTGAAKILFEGLSAEAWGWIEEAIRTRSIPQAGSAAELAALECLEGALVRAVAGNDPFQLMDEMDDRALSRLLLDYENRDDEIALFSVRKDAPLWNRVLALLPRERARRVMAEVVTLERLPRESLENAAFRFAGTLHTRFLAENALRPVPPPFRHRVPVRDLAATPSTPARSATPVVRALSQAEDARQALRAESTWAQLARHEIESQAALEAATDAAEDEALAEALGAHERQPVPAAQPTSLSGPSQVQREAESKLVEFLKSNSPDVWQRILRALRDAS